MEKSEIIILVAVLVFVGFRLYQKYVKKTDVKPSGGNKVNTAFSSSPKDDDYEPYAKK